MVPTNPVAEIGWEPTQPDEAAVWASPKGQLVLSEAWNLPKAGESHFQHPGLRAPREARRPWAGPCSWGSPA
eukprot:9940275-Alexandrium_andersonii.AAC.1